jgi:hypothetical protein
MKLPPLLKATVNFLQKAKQGSLEGITSMMPEVTYNSSRTTKKGKKAPDGIEIRFGKARPTEKVRELLKKYGFRFSEKQKIWYAYDDANTRKFIQEFSSKDVEVDDTEYEKLNFWARVKSIREFEKLYNRTEFMVKQKFGDEAHFFNSKKELERDYTPVGIIKAGILYFKKFYNKVIGEEGKEKDQEEREPSGNKYEHIDIGEKLKAIAEGMEKQINAKLNPPISKQRPTQRRIRIASGIQQEGWRLHEIQSLLYSLSEVYRFKAINKFPSLAHIRTKAQAELITKFKPESENEAWMKRILNDNKSGFEKIGIQTYSDWKLAFEESKDMAKDFTPASAQGRSQTDQEIKDLENKLVGMKIPGFFPTPQLLIERMIELLELREPETLLEPSAGKGDILDAIMNHFDPKIPPVSAIEPNSSLRDILTLKGYPLVGTDFLEHTKKFDKIIMNPPFENGQDIDHVTHALSLLKPGGRVVAIMGEGAFFRQFKKDAAFRKLLEEKGAYVSEPIKDAFKDSFNSTGVNVRIVAIDKDKSMNREIPSHDEDTRLSMEAEAELEILKLRVEMARKKKKELSGFSSDQLKRQRLERKAWELENKWQVLNFN